VHSIRQLNPRDAQFLCFCIFLGDTISLERAGDVQVCTFHDWYVLCW